MIKKILTEESEKSIKSVFEKTAIFTIDEFPIETAGWDVGVGYSDFYLIEKLRAKWLFDRFGIYEDLRSYNSFYRRVHEFMYYGDYLHTLRQRINIVHVLMECNFNTKLPIHISIGEMDDQEYEINELNLFDMECMKKFLVIAHPGQTRFQASVFTNTPLKNTLIYINKKLLKKIKINTVGLKRINNVDELLEHYNPDMGEIERTFGKSWKESISHFVYDFIIPGQNNNLNLKYHGPNDTYILKVKSIIPKIKTNTSLLPNFEKRFSKSYHASYTYREKSFVDTDKFFRILFNNKINVYTTNKEELNLIEKKIYKNLLLIFTGIGAVGNDKMPLYGYLRSFNDYNVDVNNNFPYVSFAPIIKKIITLSNNAYTKDEIDVFKKVYDLYSKFKTSETTLNFNIKETEIQTPIDYVKRSDYRGICLVINKFKYKRLLSELLFLIPHEYSIVKSIDEKIMIINCEHEYWKSNTNYKEYILTDRFLNG